MFSALQSFPGPLDRDRRWAAEYYVNQLCQTDAFVGRLVDWYCSEESPVLTRQTCCVYCASFICRANFISIDIIRSVLYFSLTWINKYIDM